MTVGAAIFLVFLMLFGIVLMARGWNRGGVGGGVAISIGSFMLLGDCSTGMQIL
jgi:hypothetical protein